MAQSGLNIGIIVNVPGATVSGTLVGRDAWLDELVRVSADISEDAGVFATGIRQAFTDDEVRRSIGEEITYDFLHLRDAYFVSGAGALIPTEGPGFLWRGRIVEVSGWTLGRISRQGLTLPG